MTRNRKREEYLRATGRGLTVTGPELATLLARVRSCHARGMSYAQMERQTGVAQRTIARVSPPSMRRSTFNRLAGLEFEEPDPHTWIDPTGTRRRLSALWADGYPLPWLAGRLPFASRGYLQGLIRGHKGKAGVRYDNARAVRLLYDKLAASAPGADGVDSRSSRYGQVFAAKRGLPGRACWDEDTIDDPEALPEWTGRCGTPYGRMLHRLEGTPLCSRCRGAAGRIRFSGACLRDLRLSRGLSQNALADQVGLTQGVVHHWESGRYAPRAASLEKLLSALDATIGDVYEEVPDE